MVWTRLVDRLRQPRASRPVPSAGPGAGSTPPDLRAHLPLLWPDGPGGAVDSAALSTLGRGYARAGRSLEDLLADLDVLCSVVGIGTDSRMIEASSVAWSDAFLDAVTSHGSQTSQGEELAEVERLLVGTRSGVWGGLVPPSHLLLVTWTAVPPSTEELARVVAETRRLFPRAAVAPQPPLQRVAAAVTESPSLSGRVATLEARVAELAAGEPPAVSVVPAPAEPSSVVRLLRPTG